MSAPTRITQAQWDQLSEDEQIYFADWFIERYAPEDYPTTLATHSQLFRFLEEHHYQGLTRHAQFNDVWNAVRTILREVA